MQAAHWKWQRALQYKKRVGLEPHALTKLKGYRYAIGGRQAEQLEKLATALQKRQFTKR
jgi:hypothetical protein